MLLKLSKDQINLLDNILTSELLRVEDENGIKIPETRYDLLADLLRMIEDATILVNHNEKELTKYHNKIINDIIMEYEEFGHTPDAWREFGRKDSTEQIEAFLEHRNKKNDRRKNN